ncbi:hypothetical protein [Corynebacterium sp. A21]|uniref:hypothetical protein n=1 Tax=Corynebacterium sp. A21 TaxID=3457318 RepID=UPI003FCEE7B5
MSSVLISSVGSSVVETGSSFVGSSTKEVVGSSAGVLDTLGSSQAAGILDLVYKAMDVTDRVGGFLDPILGLF